MATKKLFKEILSNWAVNANSAAAIAFFTVFSFSPLLILSFNLVSFFIGEDLAKQEIIRQLTTLISLDTVNLIQDIFEYPAWSKFGTSLVSLVILFYASSKVFSVLRTSFNKIFGIEAETRKEKIIVFIEGQIISFVLVPVTCLFFLASILFDLLVRSQGASFLGKFVELPALVITFNTVTSFLVLAFTMFSLIKFLPASKIPSKEALIGAFTSALLFELGRFLLTLYLSHSFVKSFYGSMGSLVVLMLWVYYSVQILLLGAEVTRFLTKNGEAENRFNSVK